MTFYGGLKSVASNLLKDKGQNLTFNRSVETAFDPKTGKSQKSSLAYTGYGAAFAYNRREIDGNLVQAHDIKLIMEATTTIPINGDMTTIDGAGYRIMNVKPTSPAGTVVMYEVQLRS